MTHHEMESKMEKISNLKDRVFAEAEKECCDKGDIQRAGLLVDMVKDLAEAEEKCAKACYYTTVIEAMHESQDPRYGYNPNRYADGRYAPSGHGNYTSGYFPTDTMMDRLPVYMMDDEVRQQGRMGYTAPHNFEMNIDSIRHDYEGINDPDAKRRMKEQLTRLVNDMR